MSLPKHKKVEDKATLALMPRNATSSSYNLSLVSDKSDKSSSGLSGAHLHTTTTNSPVLRSCAGGGGFFAGVGTGSSGGGQSRGGPTTGVEPNSATLRVFHLVKPTNGGEHGMLSMQDGGQVRAEGEGQDRSAEGTRGEGPSRKMGGE